MSAEQLFRETFGAAPAVVASAPGRVNLIGEHTDYNNGLVLPFAIDARATVAVSPLPNGGYEIVSAQRPGEIVRVDAADVRPGGVSGWAAYVVGSGWVLEAPQGFRVALASDVPVGAGLSSSAAVECAAALAFSHLTGTELPPAELARRAQRAENDFVGMPCGLMDQMASAAGRPGHVLFFDIGADTVDLIPFDPGAQDLAVLLIDTRAHHSLADGEYAQRRAQCERAAAELGVTSLRDLDGQDLNVLLNRLSEDVLRRRVRHVLTENDRVRRVVNALRNADLAGIGPDMVASHTSLRDDYEVSCAELDLAVQAAMDAGAIGARMTGGGFGGSVVSLIRREDASRIRAAVEKAFADYGFTAPVAREVSPADGARIDETPPA